jgi:hypothetical protein
LLKLFFIIFNLFKIRKWPSFRRRQRVHHRLDRLPQHHIRDVHQPAQPTCPPHLHAGWGKNGQK